MASFWKHESSQVSDQEHETRGHESVFFSLPLKREFFVDNLLVQIHLIIEIILVDRPCAMALRIHFSR